MKDSGKPVARLRNLGPASAAMLAAVEVRTLEELRVLGAVRAYLRLKTAFPRRVSRNMLWAIAAGLDDRDWRDLTAEEKSRLLAEVRRRSR
ncbi:MAG: TfoX/Sxy family protein [Pseudomonadota bacterium]|nr:TfoX/Sxy family protein [Pseudomonadota bacterium]